MKVNLRNILLVSHEDAPQRIFYVQPISEYQFTHLDIFFYSDNWNSHTTLLTKTLGLTVKTNTDEFPINQNSPGTSPTNPITIPYVATGADRTWINIFDLDINTLSTHTSTGWGSLTYGGPSGIGWGGVAPDDDNPAPDTPYYLDDIICVIQPSLINEGAIVHGITW